MTLFCKGTPATPALRGEQNDDLDVGGDSDQSRERCWTSGAVLGSVLYILVFELYHNPSRRVLLPSHFTGGKTEAQKVVASHSSNKAQKKDLVLGYRDSGPEKANGVGSWR